MGNGSQVGEEDFSYSPGRPIHVPRSSTTPTQPQQDEAIRHPFLDDWAEEFPTRVRRVIQHEVSSSSQSNYSREFSAFVAYCTRRHIAWRDLSVVHILTFLEGSLAKAYAFNTIKVRSCALKFYIRRSSKKHLAEDPRWKSFMRGMKKLARQPEPKTKSWDPQDMLDFVEKRVRQSSVMGAGKEALILLMLATGLRVDDIHKLSRECHAIGNALCLKFHSMRKCPKSGKPLEHFYLKRFEVKRLCPVRAILHYLKCSQRVRDPNSKGLFISSRGTDSSLWTLRRWASSSLADAGINASPGSCRAAATSKAIESGVPVPDVLASAGWATESTFRRFYCRELLPSRSLLTNKQNR